MPDPALAAHVLRTRRGRALIYQALALCALVAAGWSLAQHAANIAARQIQSGFGFLRQPGRLRHRRDAVRLRVARQPTCGRSWSVSPTRCASRSSASCWPPCSARWSASAAVAQCCSCGACAPPTSSCSATSRCCCSCSMWYLAHHRTAARARLSALRSAAAVTSFAAAKQRRWRSAVAVVADCWSGRALRPGFASARGRSRPCSTHLIAAVPPLTPEFLALLIRPDDCTPRRSSPRSCAPACSRCRAGRPKRRAPRAARVPDDAARDPAAGAARHHPAD